MTQLGHAARGSAASTVAETFYSRLLWRSCNSCAKLSPLAASALAPLSLDISEPALAACSGTFDVVCTAGNYTSPINVSAGLAQAVTLTLESGVVVSNPGGNAVNIDNSGGGPIAGTGASATLVANDATITNITNSTGSSALRIQTNGSATITASGQIEVAGLQSTNAIWAIVLPSSNPTTAATVNYNGPGVTSVGTTFSTVIQAENDGAGPAIINAAGNMTGVALGAAANGITGLFASGGSSGTVNYTSGTIAVRGNFANGIYAAGDSATVNTAPGTTITVLSVTGERLKPGIALDAFGTAAANQALRATVESTIQMIGPAAPDSNVRNNGIGIRAFSFGDAPIFVTLTGNGSITTFGGNGIGIAALSGGGSINVTSIGQITTNGSGSIGIFADATNLVRSFPSEFRATPVFTGTPGTVEVNATNVTTTGQFSTGIVANGALGATVNIASGGSVNGGWQAGLTGGSGLFGLPAAGVILNSTGAPRP